MLILYFVIFLLLPIKGNFFLKLYIKTVELIKSLCEYKNVTPGNNSPFYYQRIELNNLIDCVERCIENLDFCKAVLFIESRLIETQKV